VVLSAAPVASERLVLPLWDAATVAALRSGARLEGWHRDFPREDDRDAASLWHDGDVWGPRSVVRGVTTLGSIGFFGPPEPAADGVPETEVGYGLVPEAWGWGFATEALRALLAHTDEAGVRIRASVAPENTRSLRVLAKCGFTQLRGPNEDGELVLARPLPARGAS
jgi:RimJ/RimL family protein N-acetyltransferase